VEPQEAAPFPVALRTEVLIVGAIGAADTISRSGTGNYAASMDIFGRIGCAGTRRVVSTRDIRVCDGIRDTESVLELRGQIWNHVSVVVVVDHATHDDVVQAISIAIGPVHVASADSGIDRRPQGVSQKSPYVEPGAPRHEVVDLAVTVPICST